MRWIAAATMLLVANTADAEAGQVRTVFTIALENHNWTQPYSVAGRVQQILGNPNAPYINSLVNGTNPASGSVSYATAYHNSGAHADGSSVIAGVSYGTAGVHPSEPSYIITEAGNNFGVLSDNDPYAASGPNNQSTTNHLTGIMQRTGKSWTSYQEDIDLARNPSTGALTNTLLPQSQRTVPLASVSGTLDAGEVNAYNGSNRHDYAAKHNPPLFFTDTNGGNDATPGNPEISHYKPLQDLVADLAANKVSQYNWITADQYNEMHTALPSYTPKAGGAALIGDSAQIRQGDDFLSAIVPQIMASDAYKNDGVILIWMDETVSTNQPGELRNDFQHTLPFIVISPDARANVGGKPYAGGIDYDQNSYLRTMEDILGVVSETYAQDGQPFIRDANLANDLSDLFAAGAFAATPVRSQH